MRLFCIVFDVSCAFTEGNELVLATFACDLCPLRLLLGIPCPFGTYRRGASGDDCSGKCTLVGLRAGVLGLDREGKPELNQM